LHYSSVSLANNQIGFIAKSVGTIGHIDNYVCLTTYNPLKYKDAKHCEASAWKKGRAVRRELRGAYTIRGFPHTHTHTSQPWKTKTDPTGMRIPWDGRSLTEPRENANLDHNNSASQVFFPFITLEAYFTSTGHNNVIYSRLAFKSQHMTMHNLCLNIRANIQLRWIF